jgi:hypothetical protein
MNQEQVLAILRILLPTALAWFAGKGFIVEASIPDVVAAIVLLTSVVWTGGAHTRAAMVGKVAAMLGTEVLHAGNVITLHDPVLIKAAKENATPVTG